MPESIMLKMECPYPTVDDNSIAAVRGFGNPGMGMHLAEPPASDEVISPHAGEMISNGRCDQTEPWEVTGFVIEEPSPDGEFTTVVLVRNNAGSCPNCGNPGAVVGGLTGKLKEVTVRLS